MKQFITECEPDNTGALILSDKDYNYLIKVRRMRDGDTLPVLLPKSGAADMLIDKVDTVRKQVRLKMADWTACSDGGIGSVGEGGGAGTADRRRHASVAGNGCDADSTEDQPIAHTCGDRRNIAPKKPYRSSVPAAAEIILLQWVLKGAKTDLIVRQAAEVGVSAVLPVIGEFSVAKKQSPAQLERYRRIIREARQQSGSPVDTVITEPAPLAGVLKALLQFVAAQTAVFGMCSEVRSERSVALHTLLAAKPARIVLAVGAEGGISPAETALLSGAGFQTIHFNTNVLRAETAALYAIAAAQTIINEAGQWQLPVSVY